MPRSIRSIPVVAAFLAAFVPAALAAALSLTVLKAEAITRVGELAPNSDKLRTLPKPTKPAPR